MDVWVAYRLCVTKGCELQDQVITEHTQGSGVCVCACVSCRTFFLIEVNHLGVHLAVHNHIARSGRGAYQTPGADCSVFRVTGRCSRTIDFVVRQLKDTRRGFASSRTFPARRQQIEMGGGVGGAP